MITIIDIGILKALPIHTGSKVNAVISINRITHSMFEPPLCVVMAYPKLVHNEQSANRRIKA